jgi:hypothetical protein
MVAHIHHLSYARSVSRKMVVQVSPGKMEAPVPKLTNTKD